MGIGQALKVKMKGMPDGAVGEVVRVNRNSVWVKFPTQDGRSIVILRKAGKHYDPADVVL